jgi:hypothetical protein
MFNKRSLFVPAAVIFAAFLGVSAANAQNSACLYTLASLQGTYAIIGNYAGNIALAMGVDTLDGQGNLTRTAIVNGPAAGSTTGARTITHTTSTGTYTVNCDGTGVYTRAVTNLTTGVVTTTVNDFVITTAVRSLGGEGNLMIATSFTDAQETPSTIVTGGVFVFFNHTRLADSLTNWK